MSAADADPFAYGIEAPIGSVTPLFHKKKDAEDFIAKLTDSRDKAKIIPLYRTSPVLEVFMETTRKICVANDDLQAENQHLKNVIDRLLADKETAEYQTVVDYQAEIDRLRPTNEEREAIGWSIIAAEREATETSGDFSTFCSARAATLRGFLARIKR